MDHLGEPVAGDFFLHGIVNPKIKTETKKDDKSRPSAPVKVEMQTLRLSSESQKLVMDTLKFIHGPDFELGTDTSYKDKNTNFNKKFWTERGNLVVKAGFDYSKTYETSSEDKLRKFAIRKLESYGFHSPHCEEVFDFSGQDVGKSLEILYKNYFNINDLENIECDISKKELIEQRDDEKSVLESIYDTGYREKDLNKLYNLTFQLEYISQLYCKKPVEVKRNVNVNHNHKDNNFKTKKEEKCRNFSKGSCKFGDKCRFSHSMVVQNTKSDNIDSCENVTFDLEIRFQDKSIYPYQPPIILLKASSEKIPGLLCLQLCRKLIAEAESLAKDGTPCIYSIVEMLKNEEEMMLFLKSDKTKFPNENVPLFAKEPEIIETSMKSLPSHYEKSEARNGRQERDSESIAAEDATIAKRFLAKHVDSQYRKMVELRKKLPAWSKTNEILNAIDSSQVVVISGETGCGKSTQVPQFILDNWLSMYAKKKCHVEIVCTQPRRISAIGVADRVASERREACGNTVGYQIRLESKVSSKTRLTFCTTGILLRRLESDPKLENVTHIIVDEVHERSEESDFLLVILKDLLAIRNDLKVILMSATLNANLFSDYFGGIPMLEIPGRTFPVEQLFLEDILEQTKYVTEENSKYTRRLKKSGMEGIENELETCDVQSENMLPSSRLKDENLTISQIMARYKGCSKLTCKNLYLLDQEKINLELIEHILTYIVEGEHDWPKEGAILVFLPGIGEITSLHDQLIDSQLFNPKSGKFMLVPLHSTLSSEEQSQVFCKTKPGVRKIVISTNIAETSVTIDDCVFVIDCGKMKEKRFDWNRNMESLEMVWVSRANAKQRKGRAGRVMPGISIHLFTSHRYREHLIEQPIPELHRVPLEQLLLRIKTLSIFEGNNVHDVLGKTIEPPSADNIDSALERLQDVGALDKDFALTALGRHLAALPVDVRIGKLMLFGAIFCCIDSALTMAACLSYKNPFVAPFGKKELADAKRKAFAVANSDQLTILKAYKKWQEALSHSRYAAQNFASENFLSNKTMWMLGDIKHQLLELLSSIGFVPAFGSSRRKQGTDKVGALTGPELNSNGDNHKLLTAILCAALYPNVVKVLTPEKSFQMSVGGAVARQPRPDELKFKTKTDGYVALHPTSVNFTISHFPSPYLVYQEKVKTSRVFVRDCSMVPQLPLLLFSGCQLAIELHKGIFVVSLEDGWILFQVESQQVAEMLKTIRTELVNLLEEKIKDPCLNLLHHEKGVKIINTIVQIVTKD